jgi:hypothetical protein
MIKLSALLVVAFTLGIAGCGGAPAPAQDPSQTGPSSSAQAESGLPEEAPARPTMTAQACEASGGALVGDIGDGAIHRPEYRCPNGAKPSGSIRAAEGGPIAIEGSVCCPH